MYEHIDSWKNSEQAFVQQLNRNFDELRGEFPPHWKNFMKVVSPLGVNRVVDIGCGAGAYAYLCYMLQLDYMGYDYSEHAINIAKEQWDNDFVVANYTEITSDHITDNDLIVANALCDVLPNGNECLEHLLSLGGKHILVQRVRLTDEDNFFKEYTAYDIMTYEFHHNEKQLEDTIHQAGYAFSKTNLYDNVWDLQIKRI